MTAMSPIGPALAGAIAMTTVIVGIVSTTVIATKTVIAGIAMTTEGGGTTTVEVCGSALEKHHETIRIIFKFIAYL